MILRVKVDRVAFPREGEEGDWFILVTDKGACKGKMRWRPAVGEQLAMNGDFSEYKGQQEFKFKEAWHDIPADSRDLLRYACELTTGIGPATEQVIWDALGDKWMDIQEKDVPKIRESVFKQFVETIEKLKTEKEKAQAVSWLMGCGATRNMAEAAWERWGEAVVGQITSDPYNLANLPHYSFRDVDDSIRKVFGITDTDPRRVRAAVSYYMRQLTDGGPTAVAWWQLKDKIIGVTSLPVSHVAGIVAGMFNDGTLHAFPATQMLSLSSHYDYEVAIMRFVEAKGRIAA
jgi:hypothetical protein